jgi:hypothetical protein
VAASLDQPAGWLLPLCLVALVATAGALVRAVGPGPSTVAVLGDRRIAALLVAASLAAALASYPVRLWSVIGLLLLVATGFVGWWLRDRSLVALASAAVLLAAGVFVSLHAEGLTLPTLGVTLVLAGLVHLRSRRPELAAGAGAIFAAVLAATVWTTGSLVGAVSVWVALIGLLVLGALVLGAPYAPAGWWAARPSEARGGLELGATISALAIGLAGVEDASVTATWTAAYLTVAGVVVTLMSLLRQDRRQVGWAGGALLALASWVRLWDLGVSAPEAYTLPSAAALLAVGLVHLRRRPDSGSLVALGPGLSLALVPSLLWVLEEPTGLRALLLGVGCLALVLAGLRLRWTAPIAVGAAVGALLVLRLAAPYIGDAVPRWVLLGAAGALLIAVGVTWERRLQEARDLLGYVRALR